MNTECKHHFDCCVYAFKCNIFLNSVAAVYYKIHKLYINPFIMLNYEAKKLNILTSTTVKSKSSLNSFLLVLMLSMSHVKLL